MEQLNREKKQIDIHMEIDCSCCLCSRRICYDFYIVNKLELKCVMNCFENNKNTHTHSGNYAHTHTTFVSKKNSSIRLFIWSIQEKKKTNRSFQGKVYVTLYSIHKIYILGLSQSLVIPSHSLFLALSVWTKDTIKSSSHWCTEICRVDSQSGI